MRQVLLTMAVCLVVGLGWSGTALAGGLLPTTPTDTQTATGGSQSATQSNDSSVTQEQGNGNLNISPAVSLFGDASTHNSQGNGNTAVAYVDQSNTADQSESAKQHQSSGAGEQSASGGDQSASQSNSSAVEQKQGNGNVNVSPAVSLFGDASTHNRQGNDNTAVAVVKQSNDADQSQSAWQKDVGKCGCDWESKPGSQSASGGDQSASQSNSSAVEQKQGNKNVNVSPAVSLVDVKHDSKYEPSKRPDSYQKESQGASTWNNQGNGNTAIAVVKQSNQVWQTQSVWQSHEPLCGCKRL